MNTPVSFQMAELLKEKGFDKPGYLQNVWLGNKYEERGKGKNKKFVEIPVFGLGSSSVLPTISDVVMWLYEKHGIWISVHSTRGYFVGNWTFHNTHKGGDTNVFNSPTDAYSSAIEYTLNKLI